jgi:hypothetical protein
MATFGELQTRIAQKLGNQTALIPQIATAINETIIYYQQEAFWFNEASTTITLTVNDPLVPDVPDDFLYETKLNGLVISYSNTRYVLTKKHPVIYESINVQAQGLPFAYKNQNQELKVYPYPDQAYSLILSYIKSYPLLVNSGDTNDWTNYAVRLIEAQTLADLWLDQGKSEDRYAAYLEKAKQEYLTLKRRSDERRATDEMITENNVGLYYDDLAYYMQ